MNREARPNEKRLRAWCAPRSVASCSGCSSSMAIFWYRKKTSVSMPRSSSAEMSGRSGGRKRSAVSPRRQRPCGGRGSERGRTEAKRIGPCEGVGDVEAEALAALGLGRAQVLVLAGADDEARALEVIIEYEDALRRRRASPSMPETRTRGAASEGAPCCRPSGSGTRKAPARRGCA